MVDDKEREEVSLVKINSEIYEKVRRKVEIEYLAYPSIKYFVEQALLRMLGMKQYDIEGIEHKDIIEKPLKELVKDSKNEFTMCGMCDKPFLKPKQNKTEAGRICPHCKKVILHFAEKLKE